MLKAIYSYLLAIGVALLIIAPSIDYTIPLMVNSFHWCYIVVVAGLFGSMMISKKAYWSLKVLSIYLFISCFFSQIPYVSFNAYILIAATFYLFLAFKYVDHKILINFIEAAFWFEVILAVLQLMERDTLMSFGASVTQDLKVIVEPRRYVFLGSVMQYMRFASVLALMAPFLLLKSRWYLVPIAIVCVLSQASNFALSLIAGVTTYLVLRFKKQAFWAVGFAAMCAAAYAFYDIDSIRAAVKPEHGGRLVSWWAIVKTWVMDTAASKPPVLAGPVRWDWIFFGHGIDTFLPLFPVYKHDMNPFPQAHNCWLQFLWEIGLVGTGLIVAYTSSLVLKLYRLRRYDLLGGLACVATNMFFAFPTRMTQTMLMIVSFAALCDRACEQLSQGVGKPNTTCPQRVLQFVRRLPILSRSVRPIPA